MTLRTLQHCHGMQKNDVKLCLDAIHRPMADVATPYPISMKSVPPHRHFTKSIDQTPRRFQSIDQRLIEPNAEVIS
jgi:hypothetical protein